MRIRTATATILTAALVSVLAAAAPPAAATVAPASSAPATAAAPRCTVTGTPRADRLTGTPRADVICGLGGNDVIVGNAGDDTLIGGAGDDQLIGGAGDDRLLGEAGTDQLIGGVGDDRIVGGAGDDRLLGEAGADMLMGDAGRDTLVGGTQPDRFLGGAGVDQVTAGSAGDTCAVDPVDRVSGSCATDTAGPTISDVQLPAELSAGQILTVTWRVTDPSGIDTPGGLAAGGFGPNTQMVVGGPPGFLPFCSLPGEATRVSGSSTDGVYRSSCNFPATTPNDRYTVFLVAADVFGNRVQQDLDFKVVNGSDDNRAPQVNDIRTDAATYAPGAQVTVTFRATDDTGVAGVIPWAVGPNGRFVDDTGRLWLDYATAQRVTGTDKDGTYTLTLKLSDTAAAGPYSFYFSARDVLGNRSFDATGSGFTVT